MAYYDRAEVHPQTFVKEEIMQVLTSMFSGFYHINGIIATF